jgi:hypothetical protein
LLLLLLLSNICCISSNVTFAASKDSTDKGDFFIFSKSKGAAVAAVPTVAAPVEAPAPAPCTEVIGANAVFAAVFC